MQIVDTHNFNSEIRVYFITNGEVQWKGLMILHEFKAFRVIGFWIEWIDTRYFSELYANSIIKLVDVKHGIGEKLLPYVYRLNVSMASIDNVYPASNYKTAIKWVVIVIYVLAARTIMITSNEFITNFYN